VIPEDAAPGATRRPGPSRHGAAIAARNDCKDGFQSPPDRLPEGGRWPPPERAAMPMPFYSGGTCLAAILKTPPTPIPLVSSGARNGDGTRRRALFGRLGNMQLQFGRLRSNLVISNGVEAWVLKRWPVAKNRRADSVRQIQLVDATGSAPHVWRHTSRPTIRGVCGPQNWAAVSRWGPRIGRARSGAPAGADERRR
jgi:hypothetical protein